MDCHVDDDKIVLKKNGKSFHWAGKFLNKECINRAAELYSFCKPIRVGFNNFGEYLFFYNHQLEFKEVFRSPLAKSFITFQPIPKFLRNMTDVNGQGGKFLKRLYSLIVLILLRPALFFKYLYDKIKNNHEL